MLLTLRKNLGTIKSLRVLRVLRPLKTIRRVPKLKVFSLFLEKSMLDKFSILLGGLWLRR